MIFQKSSLRKPLSFLGTNPGPGSYSLKERLGEAPKYGMRPKTAVIMKRFVPGPGAYTPGDPTVQQRPPSAVMGKQLRSVDFSTMKGNPGPGSYSKTGLLGGPRYTFGVSRGSSKFAAGPGPGSYRIPCSFAAVPRYLLPNRSEEFEKI